MKCVVDSPQVFGSAGSFQGHPVQAEGWDDGFGHFVTGASYFLCDFLKTAQT